MKWNGQIREAFSYKGDNKFAGGLENQAIFQWSTTGETKLTVHFMTVSGKEFNLEGVRSFKYNQWLKS